jgi:hypothetical protein
MGHLAAFLEHDESVFSGSSASVALAHWLVYPPSKQMHRCRSNCEHLGGQQNAGDMTPCISASVCPNFA